MSEESPDSTSSALPLAGVTVLDLTKSAAGPYCTMILGDMGATVIKVERPGAGDDTRSWGPPFWDGSSASFLAFNRNKKSIVLDIKDPEGKKVLARLVEESDVLVDNLRAGTLERLGFGWDQASRMNPALVYCSMSAFGSVGPMKDDPGYDVLMQAFSGLMSVTGEPGRPPVRVGTSLVDMGMGMWGAIGILGALLRRRGTGRGQLVETSLFETALGWLPYQILGYFGTGETPQRYGSGLPMLAPYQAYPTRDGSIVIAVGNDGLWAKLCVALGIPESIDDERFARNPDRVRNREELFGLLASRLSTAESADWAKRLAEAGVPNSPIQTIDKVVEHPQTLSLDMLRRYEHPDVRNYTDVGMPVRWDGERPETRRVPPRLGNDSRTVLRGIGLADDEIDALIAGGVTEEPDLPATVAGT
jgi:crotonobetainyl-CoA:carnitine CoA-transferase CaiB-like acyl-CoA transferase